MLVERKHVRREIGDLPPAVFPPAEKKIAVECMSRLSTGSRLGLGSWVRRREFRHGHNDPVIHGHRLLSIYVYTVYSYIYMCVCRVSDPKECFLTDCLHVQGQSLAHRAEQKTVLSHRLTGPTTSAPVWWRLPWNFHQGPLV